METGTGVAKVPPVLLYPSSFPVWQGDSVFPYIDVLQKREYEKLSKKEQQRINKAMRGIWDKLNPVTRKPQNSKAYNRRKSQNWKRKLPPTVLRLFIIWLDHNSLLILPSPISPRFFPGMSMRL